MLKVKKMLKKQNYEIEYLYHNDKPFFFFCRDKVSFTRNSYVLINISSNFKALIKVGELSRQTGFKWYK